jgi:hypothetical protein
LEEQSSILLEKLRVARVGIDRPVVFITHSFGGLVCKQMLIDALSRPLHRHLPQRTVGVVFYAVPHRGSPLAQIHPSLYRATPVMDSLRIDDPKLLALNEQFFKSLPFTRTLSLGEGKETPYNVFGGTVNLDIVRPFSANPLATNRDTEYSLLPVTPDETISAPSALKEVIQSPCRLHAFALLDANHMQICKPESKADRRYHLLVQFLRSLGGDPPLYFNSEIVKENSSVETEANVNGWFLFKF